MNDEPRLTRERYLLIRALEHIPDEDPLPVGDDLASVLIGMRNAAIAKEAVWSTALEHPEWDMQEEKTWAEWERGDG